MRSTAISPDHRRPSSLARGARRLSLALALLAAAAPPALAQSWSVEFGPVLSWTPPIPGLAPASCTRRVARDGSGDATSIQTAVNRAVPGDVLCVAAGDYRDELVHIEKSGAPGAPITLRALGRVTTAGFVVEADDVLVMGFTVDNAGQPHPEGWAAGFHLAGRRLGVIGNTIQDPGGYGIHCHLHAPHCEDTAIIGNTVRGADGIGINAMGRNILVEGNDVAGSIRRTAGDADGIRFFGDRLLIRGNLVHAIFDRGWPTGQGPHTDCFQTFDSGRPSTRNVVIEDNLCLDVDHQCLMAEAPLRREGANLVFRRNVCANNGSQGVLVRDFRGVTIEANLFLPTIHYNAVVLRQNVRNARIACNLVIGRPALHEIDASSRRGVAVTGNHRAATVIEASAAHQKLIVAGCPLPPLEPWLASATPIATSRN